jgi:hypothetical protein
VREGTSLVAGSVPVFTGLAADVADAAATDYLIDCDYLFLASDSMQARLPVNAVIHQYLIPACQVGAKAQVDPLSGELLDVFSVVRLMTPGQGCLWCNHLIPPGQLQAEATSLEHRRVQRYINEDELLAPSVITLNAVTSAHAVDDYLFSLSGLLEDGLVSGSGTTRVTKIESPRPLDATPSVPSARPPGGWEPDN